MPTLDVYRKLKLIKIVLGIQLVAFLLLAFTSYISLHSAYYHVASANAHLRELKESTDLQPQEKMKETHRLTDLELAEVYRNVSKSGASSASTLFFVAVIGSAASTLELFLLSRFQRKYIQSELSTPFAPTSLTPR
jgi:hypothetical protein